MKLGLPNGDNVDVHLQLDGMDLLEQVLRTVEAEAEERGWDQPPVFLCLNRPANMGGSLTVKEITWLPPEVYENPGPGLLGIARGLTTDHPIAELLRQLAHRLVGGPTFYGLVALTEAWMVSGTGPIEPLGPDYQWNGPGPMPREHPDRKEIRNGTMVTVDGHVSMLVRVRGEFPEFHEMDSNEGIETGGRVVDALRMMCTTFHDAVTSAE
jgi:hypothetical protein